MERKDKESQSENFKINADQPLKSSTDYQKFMEKIIPNLKALIAEEALFEERFLLKIKQLELENAQLKSNQKDLGKRICSLLRRIEVNWDGFDYLPQDRTLAEFISNKLVTFKGMKKLQEQNQMLLSLVRETIKLEKFRHRVDLEKCHQHAIQLQQVMDVLIEKLKMENENLQKELVTLNDIARTVIIHITTRDASIRKTRIQLRQFKKDLLSVRQDYWKNCKNNSDNMRLCVSQFDIMLKEVENTVSEMLQIQSLGKQNEDVIEELKIQQANGSSYLLRNKNLDEKDQATKHNSNIREAKLVSSTEHLQYLEPTQNKRSKSQRICDATKNIFFLQRSTYCGVNVVVLTRNCSFSHDPHRDVYPLSLIHCSYNQHSTGIKDREPCPVPTGKPGAVTRSMSIRSLVVTRAIPIRSPVTRAIPIRSSYNLRQNLKKNKLYE